MFVDFIEVREDVIGGINATFDILIEEFISGGLSALDGSGF